jgi:hypothetical protein
MVRAPFFLCPIMVLCIAAAASAADIIAASCSSTAVQEAINSAADADTVYIPAGTCVWTEQVTIPSTKGITLQGAGQGVTIIQGMSTTASTLVVNVTSGHALTRVTGLTMDANGVTKTGTVGWISLIGSGLDVFRVDHVTVNDLRSRGILVLAGGGELGGLIDHVTINMPNNGSAQGIAIYSTGPEVDTPYSRAFTPGTNKSIYIEDSTFNYDYRGDSAMDASAGARFVFRYNTLTNTNVEWHGADSGGYRGVHTFEVYRNKFASSVSMRMQFHRSGAGVSFDNTYTGAYSGLNLSVYRARPQTYVAKYGQCDGSSAWDGNVGAPGAPGWPCLDQTGYTFTQNSGGSYTSNPLYAWKNTRNGVEVAPTPSEVTAYLVENRDFFSYNPSFNGTRGVGVGVLANRPATCTKNVAYWATDRGSWNSVVGGESGVLYRCTATNKWSLYYMPYAYPHPLQAMQSNTIMPGPPGGLVVK